MLRLDADKPVSFCDGLNRRLSWSDIRTEPGCFRKTAEWDCGPERGRGAPCGGYGSSFATEAGDAGSCCS